MLDHGIILIKDLKDPTDPICSYLLVPPILPWF